MRVGQRLLWIVGAVIAVAFAVTAIGHPDSTERLRNLAVGWQLSLPVPIEFERFLVLLAAVSFLAAVLIFVAFTAVLARLSLRHQRKLGATATAALEVAQIKAQHWRQYGELLSLGQLLTKRLEKRALLQTIVEAAGRVTSTPQVPSVVGCWLLNLETDTLRFEKGLLCDETLFVRTEFQPVEPPFSQVIPTQSPTTFPAWHEGLGLVRPEQAARLGGATAALLVPLVIEESVLGVLSLFCHPEVLKRYEEEKPFYEAVWGELTLALAIAIQGEVAILDRLTGVHNREYFMKRFMQEIERANRYRQPLSLLMIDIDNFKPINDTLGHQQGDAILKIIAKLLKKSVRAIDLAARYGGEEFVVLLPETGYGDDPNVLSGAPVVAERIRQAVEEEFRGMQKPLGLTVSIGVALRRFPEDRTLDFRDLIRLADEQLIRAKTTGKNKVCVFLPEKSRALS